MECGSEIRGPLVCPLLPLGCPFSGGRYSMRLAQGSVIAESASSLNAGSSFSVEQGPTDTIPAAW